MKINTVRDLIESTERAKSVLEVTREDTDGWLQNRVTQHFTLTLVELYTKNLIKLKGSLSQEELNRTQGEIRLAEQLIEQLTETNND